MDRAVKYRFLLQSLTRIDKFVLVCLRYRGLILSSNVEVKGGPVNFKHIWLLMYTFQKSWFQYQHIPTQLVKSVKELCRCRQQRWASVTFWCGSGFFLITYPQAHYLQSEKLNFWKHFFSNFILQALFMRKGKDPDPDPYLWLIDPDPGGQKQSGPRSPTLVGR